MQRTAMAIASCLLLACGAPGDADPVSGSHATSALTPDAVEPGTGSTAWDRDSVRASSAAKVSVCHRAGGRWVPLTLPEAAVKSHVGNHGDFVYDVSEGQCCSDADCGGLSCRLSVGLDGESLIGMCPRAGGGMIDPKAALLAMGIFGSASGFAVPFTGVLSRDATGLYSLSFTLNGIGAQVRLANFVPSSGTTLAENFSTQVTVTLPPRDVGLITFDPGSWRSYLNLNFSVTPPTLLGVGTVDLINADVAGFTLEITAPDYPVVFVESAGSYGILDNLGPYVHPTSYIGDGSGPAGFYIDLPDGMPTIHSNVLVFREAAYSVSL
ncbi:MULTISPECIES: hypothetical protein [unclassified Anaeromyxobacter]|uniref:hypothetical protein n=1 Tax=unclassified Anaeromyxobacter TaxID=2620896 RepID=UPI001F5ADAAD|nr:MULTISPECIES: hypothetical protein [unclassified Anaeromyxobacter]